MPPSSHPIRLGDWISEHLAKTDSFMMYWLDKNRVDPQNFPEALPHESWMELLEAYEFEGTLVEHRSSSTLTDTNADIDIGKTKRFFRSI